MRFFPLISSPVAHFTTRVVYFYNVKWSYCTVHIYKTKLYYDKLLGQCLIIFAEPVIRVVFKPLKLRNI